MAESNALMGPKMNVRKDFMELIGMCLSRCDDSRTQALEEEAAILGCGRIRSKTGRLNIRLNTVCPVVPTFPLPKGILPAEWRSRT